MKFTKAVKKFIVTLLVGVSIYFIINFVSGFSALEAYITKLEYAIYDISYQTGLHNEYGEITTNTVVEDRIILVDIDELSLKKLGPYWHWPRTHHGIVVDQLHIGAAASTTFDIMFKTADFGKKATTNTVATIGQALPEIQGIDLTSRLNPYYNYDSMFVKSIHDAGNVIVAATLGRTTDYTARSVWEPMSTSKWADSINQFSALKTEVNYPFIDKWDLLDNIFPQLGSNAHSVGLVNVVPDLDGVHRAEPLLHGFPNPSIDASGTPSIYPVIALQTALYLTGNDIAKMKIKAGKYIDIGKPLGIFKDSAGTLQTTFPHLSGYMLQKIYEHKDSLLGQQKNEDSYNTLAVASQVYISNDDNEITAEIFDAQSVTTRILEAILHTTDLKKYIISESKESLELTESITINWDDDEEAYLIEDGEDEEEVLIDLYTVTILQENAKAIRALPNGEKLYYSINLSFARHILSNKVHSNVIILTENVIEDLLSNYTLEHLKNLKPQDTLRVGDPIQIPIDHQGRMQVNYSMLSLYPSKGFKTISYSDIIQKRIPIEAYQGKVFILGSTATALFDFVSAPSMKRFPGLMVHANMLENIMNNNFMRMLDDNYVLLLTFLGGLLIAFSASYLKPVFSLIILIVMSVGLYAFTISYFEEGLYLRIAQPLIAMFTSFLVTIILRYIFEEREKKQAVEAFKSYISPELIDEMLANDQKPSLGGEENFLTAYFTDIASFSTFSEKIGSPSKLVELLNEYLTAMTNILLEKEGTLDKYEGDAIIAFFGAPVRFENHAQVACEAALMMQKKLDELRDLWASQGEKWPVIVQEMRMRIGINSGQIVTGNMGSAVRMNYTMMGDAVNLAARLESGAKQYGVFTMCSQETLDATEGDILSRQIDVVKVVGKSDPVYTYELLDKIDTAPPELTELCEKFTQARELYNQTKWAEAEALFTECLDIEPHHPDRAGGCKTTPSHVYIERCQEYATNPPVPPGEPWDGVYTATEK